jgi:hypothetical protein
MIRDILWTWAPWIYNNLINIYNLSTRLATITYRELSSPDEWFFLLSDKIPISSKAFSNIPDDSIRWRCSLNPPLFIDPANSTNRLKHISYLGFTVNIPGNTIDLTEWINDLRWSGVIEPSAREIFTLWCCDKARPYFHLMEQAEIEIITETGDTVRKGLNESLHTTSSTDERTAQCEFDRSDSNRTLDTLLSSSGC